RCDDLVNQREWKRRATTCHRGCPWLQQENPASHRYQSHSAAQRDGRATWHATVQTRGQGFPRTQALRESGFRPSGLRVLLLVPCFEVKYLCHGLHDIIIIRFTTESPRAKELFLANV